jgi:hypothetical protein
MREPASSLRRDSQRLQCSHSGWIRCECLRGAHQHRRGHLPLLARNCGSSRIAGEEFLFWTSHRACAKIVTIYGTLSGALSGVTLMADITLWGFDGSTYVRTVKMLLAEKHVSDFKQVPLNVLKGEPKTGEHWHVTRSARSRFSTMTAFVFSKPPRSSVSSMTFFQVRH